jgi:rhomboid protease GluP
MPKCSLCGNDFAGNGILCPACYAKTPRTVVATRRKTPWAQQYMAILRLAPVTGALIAINLLIYFAMLVSMKHTNLLHDLLIFPNDLLLKWGADYAPYTRNGEWWRLLTSTFVHFDLLHVALNMWCLLMLGPLAEVAFGKIPYLAAYLATGLCASLTSTFYHPNAISAGASGAIFGVAGFLITPVALKRLTVYSAGKSSVLRTLVQFAILNLVLGQALSVADNSAHVGGLVSGLIIGLFFALHPRTVGYAPDPPPSSPPNPGDQSFESRRTREIGR